MREAKITQIQLVDPVSITDSSMFFLVKLTECRCVIFLTVYSLFHRKFRLKFWIRIISYVMYVK